jgi:hypothetical protein
MNTATLLIGQLQWLELSSFTRTLGSWVRIQLKARMSVYVYLVYVLLYVGNGLATG